MSAHRSPSRRAASLLVVLTLASTLGLGACESATGPDDGKDQPELVQRRALRPVMARRPEASLRQRAISVRGTHALAMINLRERIY